MPESQKLTRSVDLEPRRGSRGASWAGLKSVKVCKRIVKTGVSRPNAAVPHEPVNGEPPAPHRWSRRLVLDGGFVHQHDRDVVLYRVHPVALLALQALGILPVLKGLNARRTNQIFPQVLGNHDKGIVPKN